MLVFILKLVLAAFIGDFLLQPDAWVDHKKHKQHRSVYLYLHCLLHAFILWMLLQFSMDYWLGILVILITHFIIDLLKLRLSKRFSESVLFIADQLAHMLVMGLVVYLYFPFRINTAWLFSGNTLLMSASLVFVTSVSAVMIRMVVSRWEKQVTKNKDSLKNAGAWIGMLERLFVFAFVVTNHWEGIGFLLAAKSVFRFGDLSKASDRILTEYILIGTLLSFALAIGAGLTYTYLATLIAG